ncbi:MAG: KH domain-containing protein [Actinomycetota bacterium]|nr:KH domain-containing protein [Actinomycetota bacterium]
MKAHDVLAYIVAELVDHPDDIEIEEVEDDQGVVLELRVNPEDVGKVIGKRGRTAKALRALVRAAGALEDEDVTVEILD